MQSDDLAARELEVQLPCLPSPSGGPCASRRALYRFMNEENILMLREEYTVLTFDNWIKYKITRNSCSARNKSCLNTSFKKNSNPRLRFSTKSGSINLINKMNAGYLSQPFDII